MRRRWWQSAAVCLLALVMLGADSSSRFGKLGHEMICVCGCGQILLECNHVGCPDSDRMIGELREQVGGGWLGHSDPELVFGKVWAHGAGRTDSRWI